MSTIEKLFQKKSLAFNSVKNYRNVSVEMVEETMSKMDSLNSTSFKQWIKNEANVSFLCIKKKDMLLEYIEQDCDSAMIALQWMIDGWSIESTAEMILKLFYSFGLKSTQFCGFVYRLVHNWDPVKIQDLFSILLVGETAAAVAHFMGNWIYETRWSSEKIATLMVPLAETYNWSFEQMGVFLISLAGHLIENDVLKQSLLVVIYDELESAVVEEKRVVYYFEMLLQIVIEESHVLD